MFQMSSSASKEIHVTCDYKGEKIVDSLGAFGNSTLSDLSGFFSEFSLLSSEKNPLRSLRVLFPNEPIDYEMLRYTYLTFVKLVQPANYSELVKRITDHFGLQLCMDCAVECKKGSYTYAELNSQEDLNNVVRLAHHYQSATEQQTPGVQSTCLNVRLFYVASDNVPMRATTYYKSDPLQRLTDAHRLQVDNQMEHCSSEVFGNSLSTVVVSRCFYDVTSAMLTSFNHIAPAAVSLPATTTTTTSPTKVQTGWDDDRFTLKQSVVAVTLAPASSTVTTSTYCGLSTPSVFPRSGALGYQQQQQSQWIQSTTDGGGKFVPEIDSDYQRVYTATGNVSFSTRPKVSSMQTPTVKSHDKTDPSTSCKPARFFALPNNTAVFSSPAAGTAVVSTQPVNWIKGDLLGQGQFGKVYVCYDVDTGREMAVKQVTGFRNSDIDSQDFDQLRQELQMMVQFNHPRILKCYGSSIDSDGTLCLFLELMRVSITKHIQRYGPLSESAAKRYTYQVLDGLSYLHSKKITHRDVKGGNVLRDCEGNVKLADFGSSKQQLATISWSRKLHGTVRYMAPEVIASQQYSNKSDVWSVGATLVEMLTGYPPFKDVADFAAMYSLVTNKRAVYELPDNISHICCNFVLKCFVFDVDHRPHVDSLMKDPFFTEFLSTTGR